MKHPARAAFLAAGLVLAGIAGAEEALQGIQPSGAQAQVIPAVAQMPAAKAVTAETLGAVTNLPIPRFVSLKANEGNVRRGPSLTHRIDWVYTHRDLPLKITAEHGHWRKVEDIDGAGGWVHYALLSGVRTVIVQADDLPMHMKPNPDSPVNAMAQKNVVAKLGECLPDWCRIRAGGYRGWVRKAALWGVEPDEIRD